jgi:hypothetical protein
MLRVPRPESDLVGGDGPGLFSGLFERTGGGSGCADEAGLTEGLRGSESSLVGLEFHSQPHSHKLNGPQFSFCRTLHLALPLFCRLRRVSFSKGFHSLSIFFRRQPVAMVQQEMPPQIWLRQGDFPIVAVGASPALRGLIISSLVLNPQLADVWLLLHFLHLCFQRCGLMSVD